jgi:hypothetical protein
MQCLLTGSWGRRLTLAVAIGIALACTIVACFARLDGHWNALPVGGVTATARLARVCCRDGRLAVCPGVAGVCGGQQGGGSVMQAQTPCVQQWRPTFATRVGAMS